MQSNVDGLAKLLLSIVVLSLISSAAKAKCFRRTKAQYIESLPIFVKGQVQNLKEVSSKKRKAPLISFDLKIIKVLKGRIHHDSLMIEYENVLSKPRLRSFKNGQFFIFGLKKIDKRKAKIFPSICSPILTNDDFKK